MNVAEVERLVITLLLCIMLGCNEKRVERFVPLTNRETGIEFINQIIETEYNNILTYEYTYNGAGVACGDVNNDGFSDLYFVGNSTSNKLFLNRGDWKFEDVTNEITRGRNDWKTGVTMADVNGDGWLDIYLCYSGNAPGEGYNLPVIKNHTKRSNQLFINIGCKPGGTPNFIESAKEFGLDAPGTFSTQSYFFDYDNDGDLDMFLLNHANMFYAAFFNTKRLRNLRHPYFGNKLYRNDNNKFVEVSEQAGLHGSGINFGLSASISDLNFDNWPDLYITNDYEEQDFCYINNRDGTFTEASHKMFAHLSKFGMGSDVADMNNDGLQDVLVVDMLPEDNHRQKLLKGPDEYDRYALAVDSGYHHQYMRNTLQLNRGFTPDSLPYFSEIAQLSGVSNTDWSWAPLFVDLDNDGLKDIFIGNGYLRDYNNMDFMKYTSELYAQAKSANTRIDYLKIIQELPSTPVSNYVYKNQDGINFKKTNTEWNLYSKSVSNGVIYADLDNDGDYDLVTNNLNEKVSLFKNQQERFEQNNYIKIKLKGKAPNGYGIGTKLWIKANDKTIFQEAYFTRGYLSSVEPLLTVGLGSCSAIEELKVQWPDGKQSILEGVTTNQVITIDYNQAMEKNDTIHSIPNKTLIKDVTTLTGLNFKHQENKFIDYKVQRLLYTQLSRTGGKMAVGDVNKDGNDDVFFCGASGQASQLFLSDDEGNFTKATTQALAVDSVSEDTDAVFFDVDNDQDLDLYVVSGGNEIGAGSRFYQDRLYVNDGKGSFAKVANAIPSETTSGGCVAAEDYDKDGDVDVFVGGRQMPGSYGFIPRSYIFQNNTSSAEVKFKDVTAQVNVNLLTPGMVTAAIWTDYNNDTWPDLILAGEWMPITVFENQKGKLRELKVEALEKSNGWWSSIAEVDLDRDGDLDYLLGNAGTNLQIKASVEEPVQLYVSDLNDDGVTDPILCYYIQGKSFPLASRDELLDQITPLRKRFTKYADYADATIYDLATDAHIDKSTQHYAYNLKSSWLENIGKNQFVLHTLPQLAQLSITNGFVTGNFNNNEGVDILAVGNFYPYKPQLGRCDASVGTVLTFNKGKFSVSATRAETWLAGDIRDIAVLQFSSGIKRIIVSRNDDSPSVYTYPEEKH